MQLNKAYNKDGFKEFLTVFLPDDFSLSEKELVIGDNYKNIKSGLVLGESKSLGVKVFYLEHEKEKDPRVALTTEAFKILSENWAKKALVVFNSKNSENWRLSLMTISFDINEKNKIVSNLSNPKRKSFFLGPNAKIATAKQFLLTKGKVKDFEDLESRFDVEVVTKEFFNNYKKLYTKLLNYLKNDKAFNVFSARHGLELEIFGKKLLGQIVFIYFLQKKGWLGAKKGDNISNGDRIFLRSLFEKCKQDGSNFFNDCLEHLFYNCLNKLPERAGSFYREKFDCQIPFLNGGLFEPINDYKWQNEFINIPNEIFSNNGGDGILDVFDLYNFTIDENTPDDQEISVDPEMLGKVFENLLESNTRKGQGAFYTPREIVHYMCRESLVNYLATNHSNLSETGIRNYVHYGEVLNEDIGKLNKIWKGEHFTPGQFKELDDLLKNIKVVDPACGSGAFLVGMLQEIVRLRTFLQLTPDSELFSKSSNSIKELSAYNLKKETIQNCLYGVDIDPGAIDIAKLRFWLSIVVEENIEDIEPLPNLDYKIMQGNSLLEDLVIGDSVIPLKFEGKKKIDGRTKEKKDLFIENHQAKLFIDESEALVEKLERYHTEYFNITDPDKKKILKKKIDGVEDELIQSKCNEEIERADSFIKNNPNDSKKILRYTEKILAIKEVLRKWKIDHLRPFFPWKLHFGEIFNRENGGFDVAIGNPPYFQLQKNTTISDMLSLLNYCTFSKSTDIYCIFYERGIQLLRNNGVLTYITSNSWMKTKYGKALRDLFVSMANPIILINFDKSQIFDSAIVESNILVLRKETYNASLHAVNLSLVSDDMTIDEYFSENFKTIKSLDSNGWIISDNKSAEIRLKIEAISDPLKEYDQKIYIGLLNGFNDAYVIDTKTRDELILRDPKSAEIIKPMLRGRDVKKYTYAWSGLWMINSHNGIRGGAPRIDVEKNYPAVYDHLLKYKEKLEIRKNKGSHWTNLRNCAYFKEFNKPKIIWGELSDSPKFAFDEKGFIAEATLFAMIGDNLKFLLGILNSRLALWYFEQITTSSGMGTNRWKKYKIEQFPICRVDDSNGYIAKEIEILVERILTENANGVNKQLLDSVDQLVYKLYKLTPEEIKIIENRA